MVITIDVTDIVCYNVFIYALEVESRHTESVNNSADHRDFKIVFAL